MGSEAIKKRIHPDAIKALKPELTSQVVTYIDGQSDNMFFGRLAEAVPPIMAAGLGFAATNKGIDNNLVQITLGAPMAVAGGALHRIVEMAKNSFDPHLLDNKTLNIYPEIEDLRAKGRKAFGIGLIATAIVYLAGRYTG